MIMDRSCQTRVIDSPEPGDFAVRAHRGGPYMPASIHRHELGAQALRHGWKDVLTADVFGMPASVMDVWHYGWRADDPQTIAPLYLDAVGRENVYV